MVKKIKQTNWDRQEFISFLIKKKNYKLRVAQDYATRCSSLEKNMSVNLILETRNSKSFIKIMQAVKIMCKKRYISRGITSVYANQGVARAAIRKLAQFAHGDQIVLKYPSIIYDENIKK